MADLYLIRHAEPALRGVFLGQLDPPLAGPAIAPARRALAGVRAAAVYSSPLRRARDTAALLPGNPTVTVLEDLREIGYGAWEGKTWRDVERGWPELARRKREDWLAVDPPGGEPWPDFLLRVARALEAVRRGALPAAVVAHQAVNAALAHLLEGRDPISFEQQYCEGIRFDL